MPSVGDCFAQDSPTEKLFDNRIKQGMLTIVMTVYWLTESEGSNFVKFSRQNVGSPTINCSVAEDFRPSSPVREQRSENYRTRPADARQICFQFQRRGRQRYAEAGQQHHGGSQKPWRFVITVHLISGR